MQTQNQPDVYFIQGTITMRIKIGISHDVNRRLKDLESSERLVLLGVIRQGGREVEKAAHKRFEKYRFHKEWFNPAPELLEYVRQIPLIEKHSYTNVVQMSDSELRQALNDTAFPYEEWRKMKTGGPIMYNSRIPLYKEVEKRHLIRKISDNIEQLCQTLNDMIISRQLWDEIQQLRQDEDNVQQLCQAINDILTEQNQKRWWQFWR